MKKVSENIKNALKQPTTQRKGKILVDGNYYEVYNVEFYADSYEDGNVIGNAIASQLDFDLPYMDKFDTFKYFDGVWTGNDYEYVDMGTFTVFDEQDEDEFNKHITAFDNLIKFNAPFEEVGTYPKTLFQELKDICQQAGVELVNTSIPNGDFEIENNQFVNSETLKTVLKAICQISGNYGIIKEDKLVLQLTNDTDETIIKNQHEPVIWKRKTYGINQVILQLGDIEGEYVIRQDDEDIEKNGVHKLVITNNPFAYTQDKRNALIDELFNQVRGFGYIPYEMNGEWLNYLDIGDKITIDGIETLVLRIQGKSPKGLESFISAPAIIDSAVGYANNINDIKNQITRTEIIVDKQNNLIQSIASKVKEISKIITGNGTVTLENAYEGPLHKLSIKGNISLIYPNNNLYPSSNIYPKIFKLQVDETIYYLDIDRLNYINSNICDEFVYENGNCYIIRRVGIDENGEMYQLANEVIEEREDILINVLEKSKITLIEFGNAILTAEYLLQNQYSDVFATEAYVNSEIKQTADEINIQVAKKVNENEVISVINLSPEKIKLKSNRLEIDSTYFKLSEEGRIESMSGKIGGYNLEPDNLNTKINRDLGFELNSETFPEISAKITNYISGSSDLTENEKVLYDLNDDGKVDRQDLLMMQSIVFGFTYINGTFKIDSTDATKTLAFIDEIGQTVGYMGLNGLKTYNLTATNSSITNSLTTNNLIVEGTFTNNSDRRLKHNIEEIDDKYINLIKELNPVSFIYNKNNSKHIGFIAQDMEKVFIDNDIEPTPINIDETGIYSINYLDLIGILWKDNQYLHKEIEKLKEMIK